MFHICPLFTMSLVFPTSSLSYSPSPTSYISNSIVNIHYRRREMIQWWRKSSRGYNFQLTSQLNPGHTRLLTHSLFLEGTSAHDSHSLSHCQGRSHWKNNMLLRSAGCYVWQTPLRPLYKHLRFWWAGMEINSSDSHPKQASFVSSLAYWTCHLPVWSGLPLSVVSVARRRKKWVLERMHPGGKSRVGLWPLRRKGWTCVRWLWTTCK